MSLDLDAFTLGVMVTYNAATTLKTLLGDDGTYPNQKFFDTEARQKVSMPYVVYNIIDSVPEYELNALSLPTEVMRVSFTIYSRTPSSEEINGISKEIEEEFGSPAAAIAVTGYEELRKQRIFTFKGKQDGVWLYTLDYEWMFKKVS